MSTVIDFFLKKALSHIVNTLLYRLAESIKSFSAHFEQDGLLDSLLHALPFSSDFAASQFSHIPLSLRFNQIMDSGDFNDSAFPDSSHHDTAKHTSLPEYISADFENASFLSIKILETIITAFSEKLAGINPIPGFTGDGSFLLNPDTVSEPIFDTFRNTFKTAPAAFLRTFLFPEQESINSSENPYADSDLTLFNPRDFFSKLGESFYNSADAALFPDSDYPGSIDYFYNSTLEPSRLGIPERTSVISTPEFNVYISCDGLDTNNALDSGNKVLDFIDNFKDIVVRDGLRDTVRYGSYSNLL